MSESSRSRRMIETSAIKVCSKVRVRVGVRVRDRMRIGVRVRVRVGVRDRVRVGVRVRFFSEPGRRNCAKLHCDWK